MARLPASSPRPPVRRRSSQRWRYAGGAVALVALVGIATIWLRSESASSLEPMADAKPAAYRLISGDRIHAAFESDENLSSTSRIDSRGTVSVPLAGKIAVRGLTLPEAEAAINAACRQAWPRMERSVHVTIQDYAQWTVTLAGEVATPGPVPLGRNQRLTVAEAIAQAGGFANLANKRRIAVSRRLADGQLRTVPMDFDHPGLTEKEFLLRPDDLIYVPLRLL